MNLITQITTINPVFEQVKNATLKLREILRTERDIVKLNDAIFNFEDMINSLSGEIANLDQSLQREIQNNNQFVKDMASVKNLSIMLFKSLLPDVSESNDDVVIYQTGKQLYPLTTSVPIILPPIEISAPIEPASAPIEPASAPIEPASAPIEIDPIFDVIDLIAVQEVETPLALDQNETIPILPEGMIQLAEVVAGNTSGLQAGLIAFSHNPQDELIENTRELLLHYTYGNYANLNTALSIIYTDPLLEDEYKLLLEAVGGPDGLSGAISQLDIYKDHTDRLSGLVLDADSPNAEETGDSTDEFINVNDLSGGPTLIFSFDARKFRSAKYMIQATAATTDRGHQTTEIYILHDNHHAYTREIASVYSQDPFVTYTTQLLNDRIQVLANTAAPNTDFVIHGTRLRIARVAESYDEISQFKIIQNHETLATYLNDGVDYVQLQSESLLHPEHVANLAREFRDMLARLSTYEFSVLSTGQKAAIIEASTQDILDRRAAIQELIDNDYNNFLAIRKLAEALQIANLLTQAYTDNNGNAIPKITLNNATIQAIEAEL